jgi:hypothetical protein
MKISNTPAHSKNLKERKQECEPHLEQVFQKPNELKFGDVVIHGSTLSSATKVSRRTS